MVSGQKGKDAPVEHPARELGSTGQGDRRPIEFEFHCRTPGVEKVPVVLTVFHDGEVLDEITFRKQGSVIEKYELPETTGKEQKLLLEVSRTWIPHEYLANFDRRKLGIGVKIGVKIHKK